MSNTSSNRMSPDLRATHIRWLSIMLEYYSGEETSLRTRLDNREVWGDGHENEWRRYQAEAAALRAAIAALSGDSSAPETKVVPALPMRMNEPWSLPEVLAKLIEATEHSLDAHSCDAHGHELFRAAANAGRSILREWQNSAQETPVTLSPDGTQLGRWKPLDIHADDSEKASVESRPLYTSVIAGVMLNGPTMTKAGDKCGHCGKEWQLSPDGHGIWHSCHTGPASNGKGDV